MDKLSVIVPTIGRQSLILCLRSLWAQEVKPDEIIVIDNSINKKAEKITFDFENKTKIKMRYFHEMKNGAAFARNRGIKEANNDILCFLDDDCIADKSWTKELLASFIKHKGKAIIKGENKNRNGNNLFSSLQYYTDELFFKREFYLDKNNIISFWLDTKNFALSKKIIRKNKIKFKKYLIVEDLDFSLQTKVRNISIFYCPKAVVAHFGRTSFLPYIVREINKTKDSVHLANKWNDKKGRNLFKAIIRKMFIYRRWKKKKEITNLLLAKIFYGKKISFKIKFYFYLFITDVINSFFYVFFKYFYNNI